MLKRNLKKLAPKRVHEAERTQRKKNGHAMLLTTTKARVQIF
jgi:hypothetical protein